MSAGVDPINDVLAGPQPLTQELAPSSCDRLTSGPEYRDAFAVDVVHLARRIADPLLRSLASFDSPLDTLLQCRLSSGDTSLIPCRIKVTDSRTIDRKSVV